MAFFGKKKEKVVDWSERYNSARRIPPRSSNSRPEAVGDLGFLGSIANSNTSSSSEVSWDNDSPTSENNFPEKKQKLVKRLFDMTEKMEDLSNQVYHLKQRVELLEKKLKINFE
jgi:hypothetical protein